MDVISLFREFEVMFISLGGIICIYLGYRLFKTGTSRPFDIFSDLKGWRFKAANIAPGILFAILGSVILCSPVIVSVISVLQKDAFINTYATKLILDELVKRNKEILNYKLESHDSHEEPESKITSVASDLSKAQLQEFKKAVVMSNGLRLRKEPGTHYQIIGSLRKGEIVTVKESRGQWLRVSTDTLTVGWVHGKYVESLKGDGSQDAPERAMIISSNPISSKR